MVLSAVLTVAFSAALNAALNLPASASHDKTVRVWDAMTGLLLHTLEGHTSRVTSLAFSRNGLYLETDQGLTLLPPPAQSISALAPQLPTRRIFVAERWLTAYAEDLLWIPASYQPSCTAVHGSRAALGYSSGRVLLLELL
ncbi:hypothetical protein CUC08_Gglean011897 [Alternaria sp. MG1]|nr:hypothetical protein CUC08_Gglean011897 [Alternaria sp. MG1]